MLHPIQSLTPQLCGIIHQHIAISFMDTDFCFSNVNASFCEMIGYDSAELLGRPFCAFCEEPNNLVLPMHQEHSSSELCIRRKSGEAL